MDARLRSRAGGLRAAAPVAWLAHGSDHEVGAPVRGRGGRTHFVIGSVRGEKRPTPDMLQSGCTNGRIIRSEPEPVFAISV